MPGRLLLNIARGVIARIIPKRNDYLLGKYSADGLATSSFRSCEYSEMSYAFRKSEELGVVVEIHV